MREEPLCPHKKKRAWQAHRQGDAHAALRNQKGPPDGIDKYLKWYKIMCCAFSSLRTSNSNFFSRRSMLPDLPKPLCLRNLHGLSFQLYIFVPIMEEGTPPSARAPHTHHHHHGQSWLRTCMIRLALLPRLNFLGMGMRKKQPGTLHFILLFQMLLESFWHCPHSRSPCDVQKHVFQSQNTLFYCVLLTGQISMILNLWLYFGYFYLSTVKHLCIPQKYDW